ncbi:ASKHA domain-containing protein [Desulfohalovibrio reitneri]|uniref:ASKHA domain-containing protein n=1 Tax=Desulfohalovibrio reitneri TaxID=1307759 RepID=UPI0004A72CF0|nr:ASKHA domain-containing protein [Desulfohalovibrio reitneri]
MVETLRIHLPGGRLLDLQPSPETSLTQALFLAGVRPGGGICGGLGRCGRCRARFLAAPPEPVGDERDILSQAELDRGVRLACRHPAGAGEVEMLNDFTTAPPKLRPLPEPADALAVDLGTTSLCWSALAGSRVLAEGSEPNPQLGAGGEVMSRLALARAGHGERLASRVMERLAALHEAVGGESKLLVLAANPAMTYLALGLDPVPLAEAPYHLVYSGGETVEVGHGLPPVLIPPLPGPFIGSDALAGLLHLEEAQRPERPYLLLDMGTNGEFLLMLEDGSVLAASVPLGPALEGVGLSRGMLAGPGAVTRVRVDPGGAATVRGGPAGIRPEVLDGGEPSGLSGTGYLSLLAELRRQGAVDSTGRFTPNASPLAARLVAEDHAPVGGLRIPAADVEELLKVRAACRLALDDLLKAADLHPRGLRGVHLAGALGEHVQPGDLVELGFIPRDASGDFQAVGNAALRGAELLACDPSALDRARKLASTLRVVEGISHADYEKRFMEAMRFAHW